MAAVWCNIQGYILYLSHNHASTDVPYSTYHRKSADAK